MRLTRTESTGVERRRRRAAGRARHLVGLVVVLALLTGATGACGGGDDPSSSPTSQPSETTVPTRDPAPDSTPEPGSEDPTDVAADAYVAGYPLVVTIRTMQSLGGLLGVNQLFWQSSLAGPSSRVIVAPNRDTLYSVAVVDLRSEPLVLTLPQIPDRYFTYQLLDAWTESFAYVGSRTTDGEAGRWALVPPGWEGDLPADVERIDAPTPQIFVLGRFLVDDEADIANVTAIRDEASLEPLSTLTGGEPGPALPPLGDPAGPAQGVPADASFYDELADALAVNPPTQPADIEVFERAERILGLGADGGLTADDEVLAAGARQGSAAIVTAAADRVPVQGGWSVNAEIGVYGDDQELRALVARIGWGANVPEEAVYPVARTDADGAPLDGSDGQTYRLRFPAGELPPVDAFWSLSAYAGDLFFAEHPSGRYTIGDRSPDLVTADDGSLEIILSHTEPPEVAAGEPVSWLPIPDGQVILMLRLYLPQAPARDGSWVPPPITAD